VLRQKHGGKDIAEIRACKARAKCNPNVSNGATQRALFGVNMLLAFWGLKCVLSFNCPQDLWNMGVFCFFWRSIFLRSHPSYSLLFRSLLVGPLTLSSSGHSPPNKPHRDLCLCEGFEWHGVLISNNPTTNMDNLVTYSLSGCSILESKARMNPIQSYLWCNATEEYGWVTLTREDELDRGTAHAKPGSASENVHVARYSCLACAEAPPHPCPFMAPLWVHTSHTHTHTHTAARLATTHKLPNKQTNQKKKKEKKNLHIINNNNNPPLAIVNMTN